MADKPGILRNLRIKRVAIVDSGANFDQKTGDGAHIMLYKSSPGVGAVHVPTAGGGDDEYETDYEKANLDAAARNALPDSAFAAVWTDDKGKHRKLPIHDAGHLAAARGRVNASGETHPDIPPAVLAAAKRKIDRATKKEKRHMKMAKFASKIAKIFTLPEDQRPAAVAKLQAKITKDDGDNDDDDYPMHKSDDPMCKCADCMAKRVDKKFDEVEKRANEAIQKANERVEKAEQLLKAEIEKRETSEMTEVLKGFRFASFDYSVDVPKYIALKRNSPEVFESVMKTLKSQEAQLADAKAWSDIGVRKGTGEGSAWAQIEAAAERIIEKSKDGMSYEKAIEKAMLANPKLVKQHRQESQ